MLLFVIGFRRTDRHAILAGRASQRAMSIADVRKTWAPEAW